jgi:HSP20 family protein
MVMQESAAAHWRIQGEDEMGKNNKTETAVAERKGSSLLIPRDIEQLIDRAFGRPWLGRSPFWSWPVFRRDADWVPEMDVFARDGKTVIRVDAPGMKREDIEVTVEQDMLVVRGTRHEEKEVKEEKYYCSERAFGEFSRALALPEGVDADDITAKYEDGVLEVTMPEGRAAAKEEAKTIQVK